MSVFLLWLLFSVLPSIREISEIIVILYITGIVILLIMTPILMSSDYEENLTGGLKLAKNMGLSSYIPALILSIFILVPNKEAMVHITGAYIVTNTETISDLPPNLAKSANKFLEDYLNEK